MAYRLILSLLLFSLPAAAQDPLDHMSDFNALVTNIANRALKRAVLDRNHEEVEIQFNNGANPNFIRKSNTLLHLASWRNSPEIVRSLLQAGANPDALNEDNGTPLIYACQNAQSETVKILLQFRAKTNITDKSGRSAYDHTKNRYSLYINFDTNTGTVKKIMTLLERAQCKEAYEDTFVLAYTKNLSGFLGACLPRELIDIEIAQHIAAPPYSLQEIEARLKATAANTN